MKFKIKKKNSYTFKFIFYKFSLSNSFPLSDTDIYTQKLQFEGGWKYTEKKE